MEATRYMHAPGECPDRGYGQDCDGIGRFGPDPYAEEIHDDPTPVWQCDGVNTGSAMDI